MRFLRRSVLAWTVVAGLVAGSAGALMVSDAAAQQPTTFQLMEENGSGVMGTATLTPMGSQTQVVVQLQNAPGPHPIHIHAGNCGPTLEPAPKFPLTTVSNNRSETMVNASVQDIFAMQHAINVHKSPQEASVYVACGSINPATGTTGAAAQPKPGAQPSPAPKPAAPAAPAAKPAAPAPAQAPKPAAAPAQAPKPAAQPAAPKPVSSPAAAPVQAPSALPRTGDAENWAIGGLAVAGAALLGVGLVARRRRA